jgi:hypothetical protein
LDAWVKEIKTHIKMGVGKQLTELSRRMSSIPKFWRIERISHNCLTYEADSGDLILF